jgi:hypothetical protein
MQNEIQPTLLDLDNRIRRSKGRPGRTISATARVTRNEQNEMEHAAKLKGQSLSEWCRDALLAAARGEAVTSTFTEVVAIRQLLNYALECIACGDPVTHETFQTKVQSIRATKHKAAAEVMQQYAVTESAR